MRGMMKKGNSSRIGRSFGKYHNSFLSPLYLIHYQNNTIIALISLNSPHGWFVG